MKSIFFSAMLAAAMMAGACNTETKQSETKSPEAPAPATEHVTYTGGEVKTISAVFNQVDAGASASLRAMVDQYILIKNSLADDKPDEAASAAKAMVEAGGKLDKSLLTAEQKKAYDALEAGLKEHAGHIAAKSDDIRAQRDHFDELSSGVYELVKNFGAGRSLYHDHCPMANDNQGADWISENRDIRNPYFGASMLTCGTVKEEIK
jgi:hypothetical protein